MRQVLRQNPKGKLSATLKSWLPLLNVGINELEEKLSEYCGENPFCKVQTAFEQSHTTPKEAEAHHDSEHYKNYEKRPKSEARSKGMALEGISESSIFEKLKSQITNKLFPTEKSQTIAFEIIEHTDSDGFFDGDYEDIFNNIGATIDEIEKVRKRFVYLEPVGVCSLDVIECYEFQLQTAQISNDAYEAAALIINNLQNALHYSKMSGFKEAMNAIRKFHNPPAIEFLQSEEQIIPDIFVYHDSEKLEVKLNDAFYPQIIIEGTEGLEKDDFVKPKIKEAKDLVDALNMRRATLMKIGLMIIDYQYDYFAGGPIRPMKLQNLADDLGLNVSTISRAIANKYISSNIGVKSLKSFFSTAISEDTSAAAIKIFVKNCFNSENQLKPMSDEAALKMVELEFGVKLERRTITKYRLTLGIPSSSERKKLYKMCA
ncbi:MAG: polymerase sigma-54 factor [Pseudomonadota bacterium]|jgi:RNA polymerase sigma-54 factor